MPNFKKDTSKFQMKNMAYWKAKFNESEDSSPFDHPHDKDNPNKNGHSKFRHEYQEWLKKVSAQKLKDGEEVKIVESTVPVVETLKKK